jgi:hypothetical protein
LSSWKGNYTNTWLNSAPIFTQDQFDTASFSAPLTNSGVEWVRSDSRVWAGKEPPTYSPRVRLAGQGGVVEFLVSSPVEGDIYTLVVTVRPDGYITVEDGLVWGTPSYNICY